MLKFIHRKTFNTTTITNKLPFSSSSISPERTLRPSSEKDAEVLFSRMGNRDGSVITNENILQVHNIDWTKKYKGNASILCRPKTVEEVSSILSYCNEEKIGVVPQAGNTGVVGGGIPMDKEIILSVQDLDQIEAFDEVNGILTCGSGCILQKLQESVSEWNHLVPIDLGAKGSCMIGGNISTNAGGSYYFRFGSIHANIIGLEVVLPNGTILDLMNLNRKDNTGYDLKHLFIGSEGTLGVVTKIALSCPRLPLAKNAAFLACDDLKGVEETLSLAKQELGEILGAFEFMDSDVLDIVAEEIKIPVTKSHSSSDKSDIPDNYRFCLLVETLGANDAHDKEKINQFLEKCMDNNYVVDGILAQDLKQVQEMWHIREGCNPIIKAKGYNYKYDLSLPIPQFYDIIEETRRRLSSRPDAICVNWGHVIDGNIHINVITPGKFEEDEEIKALLEPIIFESVVRRSGSISAEHGLGQQKNKYLGVYAKNQEALSIMKSMKELFDPNGIMNPGKYLP
mmetsp:Transcript_20134/g.24819  ORF Transcript_20134/g.24819 Transcript_20134/m.24819 type:complete len:511 (+) Transcript_20134:43-1575(+)